MVVHGPEAFDCGDVAWLMQRLRPARVLVAGVMARTAAEESGLSVEYVGERPSVLMARIPGQAFLVNHGKTPDSGRIFGEIVADRMGCGLVQLECSSHTVYLWDGGDAALADALARLTGFEYVPAVSGYARSTDEREIRGCIPGEAVFVNGIVIGRATAGTVVLAERDGRIEPVSGLIQKPHGFEKLAQTGLSNIAAAWCKSGTIRSASPENGVRTCERGTVLVVDHCGHTIYGDLGPGICGVLGIGDDTTAVCGHICAHRGIPVFGIVDGDSDGILSAGYAPGSVVALVVSGRDDDVGRDLAAALPQEDVCWDEWVEQALAHLGDSVRIVADLRRKHDEVR